MLVAHDRPDGVPLPGRGGNPLCYPDIEINRAAAHRRRLRTVVDATQPATIWHAHHATRYAGTADLGYGPVAVQGLAAHGTNPVTNNIHVVDLAALARPTPQGALSAAPGTALPA